MRNDDNTEFPNFQDLLILLCLTMPLLAIALFIVAVPPAVFGTPD
jgi:hypothetical protein